VRQGQNALSSLSLSAGLTPSYNLARLWLVVLMVRASDLLSRGRAVRLSATSL